MANIYKTGFNLKKNNVLKVSGRGVTGPVGADSKKTALTVSLTNGEGGFLRVEFTPDEAKEIIESFSYYIAKYSL